MTYFDGRVASLDVLESICVRGLVIRLTMSEVIRLTMSEVISL